MFGTIRKHQTWLWVIIIVVISLSMVVFFSSDVSLTGGPGQAAKGEFGTIDGKPITQSEFFGAYKEPRLGEYLRSGKWPGSDDATTRMVERQAINRVYLIHKMRQMDIEPSEKAIGLIVQEQIRDYPYAAFERDFLKPNGLTAADYERFVRNEAAIRQLVASAAITSRLVDPKDAETLWKRENQEIDTKVAIFTASNYLSKVVITNGALESFYTNRMGAYRLPERTVISYIAFNASNYLAEADQLMTQRTNLNDLVNEYYFRGGTNVWKDTNGVPLAEAEAKNKIRDEIRLDYARVAARRAAAEFGNELMSQPDPNKLSTFETLAAQKKLPIKTTQPFDRMSGLDEFAHERVPLNRGEEDEAPIMFTQTLRERAMALTDERPVQFTPIPGYDAVYLIARKAKIPSEQQSFEAVKAKLPDDYKNFLARDLASKAGYAFHTNLTNGLKLNKSFDELAAADNVQVIDVPPFSPSTTTLTNLDPRINLRLLQNIAGNLEVGQASSYIPQMGSGLIIYVTGKPSPDPSKMAQEMPEFVATLRQIRQGEVFNNWFRREAERDRLVIPVREASVGPAN
jgi:hypothetical protein